MWETSLFKSFFRLAIHALVANILPMCRSMVDIQSATAEIRPGKKQRRRKRDKNIMYASAAQGGHD